MADTDYMGGFAKGLAVIEAFDEASPRMTIADVAKRTGLDRATARRCLLTLSTLGYADYDGKFFTLTQKILRLGHAYLSATPLPKILQPHLDQLSDAVGQSASASVLDGTEVVYIARAAQKRVMSISLMAGSRLPAYCASMGRVLLAALPEDEARAILAQTTLKANTPHTKTNLGEILAELRRVRAQGYAIIDQELEIGLCSIAVPIENARGRVVAAINIGVPAAHLAAEHLAERYLPALKVTQRALNGLMR